MASHIMFGSRKKAHWKKAHRKLEHRKNRTRKKAHAEIKTH